MRDIDRPAIVRPAEDLAALLAAANAEHDSGIRAEAASLGHYRKAGEALLRAKAAAGHGKWLQALKEQARFSQQRASEYMRLAAGWGKLPPGGSFALKEALRVIAGESAEGDDPPEAEGSARFGHVDVVSKPEPAQAQTLVIYSGEGSDDDRPALARVVTDSRPAADLPPLVPTPADSWPHSERLVRWLKAVSSQTHVINIELGGIDALLAEQDKWDWRDVREFILPMLEAVGKTIEGFRVAIGTKAGVRRP